MNHREAREHGAASAEARRVVPTFAPAPAEEFHQDMMVRYLQAMAAHSHSEAAAVQGPLPAAKTPVGTTRHPHAKAGTIAELQVRDIVRRSAAGIPGDTPFLDVARMLARQQTGAIPVVDDAQQVIGVVAESDLLARAASLTAGDRPGAFARMLRSRGTDAGVTAATLMSAPALTVHPWTSVIDAARTAARSRIRQLFVTDHKGHLVGVISRGELLQALVRDDAAIRAEVVACVVEGELGIDPARVQVQVLNGTVTMKGSLDAALIPRLRSAVEQIPDVVAVADRLIAV
ncbi:CBS domain-containing protein [Streptomyces sp. NBC_01451]|uniref:CBS domain-containing protein n=1 Tax=Streptomyces sp. NBC_01451 TaxID=2903872 RepID=UPI002E3472A3|nr:CBS domain-containing protein [Streptomyces sp. NBC_01451]